MADMRSLAKDTAIYGLLPVVGGGALYRIVNSIQPVQKPISSTHSLSALFKSLPSTVTTKFLAPPFS